MKLVYTIIAHHQFEQFRRLIERLNKPDVSFVFHISSNCEPGFYEQVEAAYGEAENVCFARRYNVYWGNFSMVRAAISTINALVESGFEYDYCLSLSGQDYPLKTHEEICETLAAGQGKQFLEYYSVNTMEGDDAQRYLSTHVWIRSLHLWYPHTNLNSWITRLYNKFFSLFLPERRTLPNGYDGYKGSFWCQLTPDCIEYMYHYLKSKEGKRLIRYYTFTYHAAEFFFHTLLLNSPYKDQILSEDHHFAIWFDHTGHPKSFTNDDFDSIMASGKLFARKFDLRNGVELFDRIDAVVDGNP